MIEREHGACSIGVFLFTWWSILTRKTTSEWVMGERSGSPSYLGRGKSESAGGRRKEEGKGAEEEMKK